jgi:RNA polymerase sigma-70 factor (ECF subfamily)
MTIATRIGISELRRRHYQDVSLEVLTADGLRYETAAYAAPSPAEEAERKSILQKLQLLIETELTTKQSVALRGVLEGLPIEEVARRTESNRNAVYKLVHDARIRIRAGFESEGLNAGEIAAVFA